jgi:hypothetical protein
MPSIPRLFVIVGTPGSGKDLLIRAVNDLGVLHAAIVPKHTSRTKRGDDCEEMICPEDHLDYDLDGCDIQYQNYGDKYGIKSVKIWEGLREGISQVAVVSDLTAIKKLQEIFGEFLVLVYVHSQMSAEEYQLEAVKYGGDAGYVKRRVKEYQYAFDFYLRYFLAFNHVLIYTGLDEDLYDQIFRLFRAYERGDLPYTTARPIASGRIWDISDEKEVSIESMEIIGGRG